MEKKGRQNSTNSTLTPKQMEVIEALAGGATVTDAAKRAGVDRTTFYFWMNNDRDFEAQLALARREFADTVRARQRELMDDALKVVRETMTGKEIPPGTRLKAALSVLQNITATEEWNRNVAKVSEPAPAPPKRTIEETLREIAKFYGLNPEPAAGGNAVRVAGPALPSPEIPTKLA